MSRKWTRISIRQSLTNDWRMRRQLVPGLVVRLTVIKAKTQPGIEARPDQPDRFRRPWFVCMSRRWVKFISYHILYVYHSIIIHTWLHIFQTGCVILYIENGEDLSGSLSVPTKSSMFRICGWNECSASFIVMFSFVHHCLLCNSEKMVSLFNKKRYLRHKAWRIWLLCRPLVHSHWRHPRNPCETSCQIPCNYNWTWESKGVCTLDLRK